MINIAQIGIGYWGPNLLRNLIKNSHCKIMKIIEIDPIRIKFVSDNFPNIKISTNLDDVLNDTNIDAVVISTPAKTHFNIAIKCLRANKHILVEKPIATTVKEAIKLFSLAEKKNLVAMSGHTFLFNSAVRFIKKYIENGELGDLIYIFTQRLNLGRIRNDINAMWNFAPHDISIIQYWLNNTSHNALSYNGRSYIQKNIDDVGFLTIQYPDNILANIHVGWLNPNKVRKITLIGSKKMIEYDDLLKNKVSIVDKGIDIIHNLDENMEFDKNNFKINYRSKSVLKPKIEYHEPLKVEIDHFLDCIKKNIICLTGKDHSINVVKILEESNPL